MPGFVVYPKVGVTGFHSDCEVIRVFEISMYVFSWHAPCAYVLGYVESMSESESGRGPAVSLESSHPTTSGTSAPFGVSLVRGLHLFLLSARVPNTYRVSCGIPPHKCDIFIL